MVIIIVVQLFFIVNRRFVQLSHDDSTARSVIVDKSERLVTSSDCFASAADVSRCSRVFGCGEERKADAK